MKPLILFAALAALSSSPSASLAPPHTTGSGGSAFVAVSFFAMQGSVREMGGMLTVGFPFDRLLPGGGGAPAVSRALAQGPATPDGPVVIVPAAPPLTPRVARRAVHAAWRAAGIGCDDSALDAMVKRARLSALLPEARLRAMQSSGDRLYEYSSADSYHTTDGTGTTVWLEARLTFRLDRLLFTEQELQTQRIRLDRAQLRARIAAKVVAEIAKWARARVDEAASPLDSDARTEALLRAMGAEVTLDVLTDGWFSRWRASGVQPRP